MGEHQQTTEITYDGAVRTGLIIRTDRGFEAHSEGHGYLATYPSRRGATKAIFDKHRQGADDSVR